MKHKDLWQFVLQRLQQKIPVMLLAVAESHGASPGKAGFKMFVAPNGDRHGTIGGGVMEMKWVEQAVRLLSDGSHDSAAKKLFHSRDTVHEPSGLICSGSQTILLKPLYQDSESTIHEIVRTFDEHRVGTLRMSDQDFVFNPHQRYSFDRNFLYRNEHDWAYEENVGILDTIYIIGSGHVGFALSRVMSMLDFRVVVIDDRPDVGTFSNNTFAHQKLLSNYDGIGDFIKGTGHEYIAVVTTAYKSDAAALKAILGKKLKYIGLMGSAAKTKQIIDDLKASGISEEQFRHVHTPIGLPISSHTPEEIAVSISAEIIKERNGSTSDDLGN